MRALTILLVFVSTAHGLYGQIETTQYFMTSLPQVVESNPAFVPKYSFALGLPFSRISGMYSNNGFCYNDATRIENGKRILDLAKWEAGLPEKTYITNASTADLFRLGLKLGSLYLSVHSSVKGYTQAMFPKDMATLIVGGTGAYVGKTANISPTFHGMTFWENGIGISYAASDKLRVGVRLKKLYGGHNMTTEKSDISLSVADNYAMSLAADLHVRTSGVEQIDELVFSNVLKNSGWSGDMGATYKVLPRLTLAASLVDLGNIRWKNNVYDYTMNKETANFTFNGLDVNDLLDGNTSSFEEQLDSLQEKFKPTETPGSPYRTALPAKFYLSAGFEVFPSFTVGSVFFAEQFRGHTSPGWSASANKNFGRLLSTSVSYTVSNRSYNNLGAGLSLNLMPVQIYLVGDNLLRLPGALIKTGYANEFVNSTQVFNFRFGVNFVWGWKKNVAPQQEEDKSKGYNSGKKESTKQIDEDNSKSFNAKKPAVKTTNNKKKQPQPSHIRARQKKKR